jgi:nitrogen fixation protein FixH
MKTEEKTVSEAAKTEAIQYQRGDIVKYSKPKAGEESFRFVVLDHYGARVEMQLICDWFLKPIEAVDQAEVELEQRGEA